MLNKCLEIVKWYIQQPKNGKHDSQEKVLGVNIEASMGENRPNGQIALGIWTGKRAQIEHSGKILSWSLAVSFIAMRFSFSPGLFLVAEYEGFLILGKSS